MAQAKAGFLSRHKGSRILLIVVIVIIVLAAVAYLAIATHPQIIVGMIQKKLFQEGASINSYEPKNEPGETLKANGILYVNDIQYGTEYENSYLDINYPDGVKSADKPTIVFFHGGGFFCGDKVMGDPLATSDDSNCFLDSLCMEGYNLVNVNYALVPDRHFPIPLIQVNQAMAYLTEHAEELNLDMEHVIIAGSSAGAILTAQYGAVLTNPEYAELNGITPAISPNHIAALVIDDAPLEYDHLGFSAKMLVGNYIKGSTFVSKELRQKYNPIPYATSDYPVTFLAGSNYKGDGYAYDMEELSDQLESMGVTHEFYYQKKDDGTESKHGFIADMKNDPNGEKCYHAIVEFLAQLF